MTAPAPLREKLIKTMRENITIGDITECSISLDGFEEAADAILAAFPTDAVQPVGGVDREVEPYAWAWEKHITGDHWSSERLSRTPPNHSPEKPNPSIRNYQPLYATAPNAGSGWLPIESAPKDGTRVIGLTKFGVEVVKWHEWDGTEYGPRTGWIGVEQDSTCCPESYLRAVATYQPTHWMPLPAAPTVGGE